MTPDYPAFFQPLPDPQFDSFVGSLTRAIFTSKNKKDKQKTELKIKQGQADLVKSKNVTAQYQAAQAKAKAAQENHKAKSEAINAQRAMVEAKAALAKLEQANAGKWLSYFWIGGGLIVVGSLVYLVVHLTTDKKPSAAKALDLQKGAFPKSGAQLQPVLA